METKNRTLLKLETHVVENDWGKPAYWEPGGGAWDVVFANVEMEDPSQLPAGAEDLFDIDHQTLLDLSALEGVIEPGRVCTVNFGKGMEGMNPEWLLQGRRVRIVGFRTSYETLGG